ncbi:hypothetical protein Tco_1457817 [Tanacetum coccineum]
MRNSFTTTTVESVRAIRSEIHMEDDETEKETNMGKQLDLASIRKQKASYDPYDDVCDEGGLPDDDKKHYLGCMNDNEHLDLKWEGFSCNNSIRIRYRKVCKMTKERILKDYWRQEFNEDQDDIDPTVEVEDGEDPKECGEDKTNAIL